MNIKIEGKISYKNIADLLAETNIKVILENRVNEKIDSIINKHFNDDNSNQTIRENFNKSISRFSDTEEFKELVIECLCDRIKMILDTKDFSKMIDASCKSHIDNVIKNLKSI